LNIKKNNFFKDLLNQQSSDIIKQVFRLKYKSSGIIGYKKAQIRTIRSMMPSRFNYGSTVTKRRIDQGIIYTLFLKHCEIVNIHHHTHAEKDNTWNIRLGNVVGRRGKGRRFIHN